MEYRREQSYRGRRRSCVYRRSRMTSSASLTQLARLSPVRSRGRLPKQQSAAQPGPSGVNPHIVPREPLPRIGPLLAVSFRPPKGTGLLTPGGLLTRDGGMRKGEGGRRRAVDKRRKPLRRKALTPCPSPGGRGENRTALTLPLSRRERGPWEKLPDRNSPRTNSRSSRHRNIL